MTYLFFLSLGLTLLFFMSSCSHCPRSSQEKVSFSIPGEGVKTERYRSEGDHFMVVTQGSYSTLVGNQVLGRGGNAVDAFVAVSFMISVERPQSTGIGGGGFALLNWVNDQGEQKVHAVDFREVAPALAFRDMFLNAEGEADPSLSRLGPLSVGVPGLVAGILELHEKFGSLPLKDLLSPAIWLAKNGFPVDPELAAAIEVSKDKLLAFPASQKIFLPQGRPLQAGDVLIQKDLARTLEKIALSGREGFYSGKVADSIVSTVAKEGGLLRQDDLKNYTVVWRAPISGTYRGHRIVSMPPPSSGGAHILQILNIVEGDPLHRFGPHDPRSVHLVSFAMQQAFADRSQYMGDVDFVSVPVDEIISKHYAQLIRQRFDHSRALKADEVTPVPQSVLHGLSESHETTHFTIADQLGNIITSTQTINGLFGSGMVAEGSGIVLNNEMDDFSAAPGVPNLFGAIGGEKNAVEAGKRPLSSMSPTIVFDSDHHPRLALGSPSGTRILTCVAQTIMNVIDHKMDIFAAVSTVRYHHQWHPDHILVDVPGLPERTQKSLEKMGYDLREQDPRFGCRVQAIAWEKQGKQQRLVGASDLRGQGMALGL